MSEKRAWIYDLLLIAVLVMAASFRVLGLSWDQNQHLHPDERFLTMVETALLPAESLSQYFDTLTSPLNPHNRGYGFFVYGTLPIIVTRFVAEWLGQVDYDHVHLVGRQLSAIADLGVILMLYLIASRLYGRKVAVLAAAFSSLAVMQIQQSHFFTVDNPANFFTFVAIYFAVLIATTRSVDFKAPDGPGYEARITEYGPQVLKVLRDRLFWLSIAFGLALGMAVASKLNAAPMAVLLPAAFLFRYLQQQKSEHAKTNHFVLIIVYLIAGGLAALLAFRVFQPYAFVGLGINPAWLGNIRELQAQSSGDSDVPFALQWARRSHLYSFENLVRWGLGLPLGILAWAGFLWMGWRVVKGGRKHALLWGWTALYFLWQSLAFNPTMRYQLPIYPLLCMMAAWLVFEIANLQSPTSKLRIPPSALQVTAASLGIAVLLSTFAWAYAFTRIYTRPNTRVAATHWIYQNLPGPYNLRIQSEDGIYQQPLPFPYGSSIAAGAPYVTPFTVNASGELTEVYLPHALSVSGGSQTLNLVIASLPDSPPEQALATASITSEFPAAADGRGRAYTLTLDRPLPVETNVTLFLRFETDGALTLDGAAPINETSWDDGLPLRTANYDGFGGLYNGGLNLELYWEDNQDKLTRFVTTLSQGDYIFMSSNRQWATLPRVPERYPLSSEYYRLLVGCPADKDVIWCYNVARPGQFEGLLGYDLVQVFESYPTLEIPGLFKWEVNDQFAEEAFTVYDHTKVLIFQKSEDFDPARVQAQLGAVDLSRVVHLTPRQASNYEYKDLLLPPDRLAQQRAGGTWSDLFSYEWPQNKFPALGLLFWYGFIFALGLASYPLVRLALPGLGAFSYPLGRVAGLVLLAYLSWLGGSIGLPYTRLSVGVVLALITAAGLGAGWLRRTDLRAEWNSNRRFFLIVEILFLAFFVFDLLIRFGNPDLWHPSKGGERPMDFSYFNAVLKSTSFPPYDPWFAGGYINYYYYGFVLVGTPVKLLGIVPTLAYNFILPTLFAMVAVGAFTVGSQLLAGSQTRGEASPPKERTTAFNLQLVAGLAAASLMVLFGNLGTIQMLLQGFQRLAAPDGVIENANFVQRSIWIFEGIFKAFTNTILSFFTGSVGPVLPFGNGDWYWNPSRVLPPGPGNEITEFPLFTFLYSDLHAHMIVMPLTLFVIAWALSFVKARARMSLASWCAAFAAAGLFIGALRPTNTWDLYTYFALAAVAITYTLARYGGWGSRLGLPAWVERAFVGLAVSGLLYLLANWMYSPFTRWYSQAYGSLDPWIATHTPLSSYLTHWSLFLFVIFFWLLWETRQWMASTPVSSLAKLRPYVGLIEGAFALLIVLIVYLAVKQVAIGWLALPLAAWAGVLLLRPGLSDSKRLALFMVGTGLVLTLVVELYTLRGDIGRQNTIFKIYLQVWTMFAVSAAAGLGWLLNHLPDWRARWRMLFQGGLVLLSTGAFLFTLTATTDKIRDRMAPQAPHTLDSMTYMDHAIHWDGANMDLSQDYRAIRWLQDNVQGSPVIVEANCSEYRWCTRFTIYTGLPGVVGWNFHQRQQRALIPPNLITDRVDQIGAFYSSPDVAQAREFLKNYDVRYIMVGQLEHNLYPVGLEKFDRFDGQYWRSVYRDGTTVIYEVLP
jgi:YYY domain-containing protein